MRIEILKYSEFNKGFVSKWETYTNVLSTFNSDDSCYCFPIWELKNINYKIIK